jgi:hypothetical protein
MAQRRMFSPDIVESDAFLDMPASSQALYFHLGMYADDDGFVNPQKIMRMMNAGVDDLKVIITKRFVLPFQSGVVVIKHWRINNLVRKDWYKKTKYVEEKKLIKLKKNGAYTDNLLVNESLPSRPRRLSYLSLDNLIESKDSIGEKKITPKEVSEKFFSDTSEQELIILKLGENGMPDNLARVEVLKFISYWTELNPTGKKQKWEMQKTFEVQRRLATWFRNVNQFSPKAAINNAVSKTSFS